jgi:hypothetical protein
VGALRCAVVGRDPRTPIFLCARPGPALGLAFFGMRASWFSGEKPKISFSAVLGLAAALGFLLCVGVLCCVVVGRDSRTPFSAALGLAFFGLRASWIAVVGGEPRPPFSAALGLAAALGFLLCVGVLCCVAAGSNPRTPLFAALGLAMRSA